MEPREVEIALQEFSHSFPKIGETVFVKIPDRVRPSEVVDRLFRPNTPAPKPYPYVQYDYPESK